MKIDNDVKKDIRVLVDKHFQELHGVSKFKEGETYIPASGKKFSKLEMYALVESAMGFEITEGERTREFEQELAKFINSKYAVFCNSGSSANLLAFSALMSPKLGSKALKPGDEVITCAVGFPTTVAPIIQLGCIPVYVDVSIATYNPTPRMIAEAITDKTRAIFLAHTLGNPLDMDAIKELAIQNDLWIIEDCCDALGSEYDGIRVGTFGHISTTSFYPAHMITTGEGGAVFTDSAMLNQVIRSLRDWGRECFCLPGKDNTCGRRFDFKGKGCLPDGFDHKYTYSHVGYNLKGTDLQASIGIEQLKKLPDFIETRRHNWQFMYDTFLLHGLDKYFILPSASANSNPAWFGFVVTLRDSVDVKRTDLVQFLEEKKIGTRNLFGGNITKQPGFLNIGRVSDLLPKADIVMTNTFWLGIHPSITEDMIDYVVVTIRDFLENEK